MGPRRLGPDRRGARHICGSADLQLFPLRLRGKAMSLATASNCALDWLIGLISHRVLELVRSSARCITDLPNGSSRSSSHVRISIIRASDDADITDAEGTSSSPDCADCPQRATWARRCAPMLALPTLTGTAPGSGPACSRLTAVANPVQLPRLALPSGPSVRPRHAERAHMGSLRARDQGSARALVRR